MKIFINYNDPRWKNCKINFQKIVNTVNSNKNSEVSIILTNDKEIQNLNFMYRGINKSTNVLSFELNDEELLGDIFISFDTVQREAIEQNKSFKDHVTHMIVHGVLHLMGYDHLTNKDGRIMEKLEIKILSKFGIANPYLETNSKKLSVRFTFLKSIFLLLFGGLAALGFAPFNFWWATIIGIAGAYYITVFDLTEKNKTKFWNSVLRIFPFSAAYATGMFWWVVNSIYVVPELTEQFAIWTIPALIGIAIFGGFIFSIPFSIISCMRLKSAYRPILFASIWTIILWLREWFLTGFPWNPIANITMSFPILANSMSLWGALGLTFIIIGFISSFVELIRNKNSKKTQIQFTIFIVLLIIGFFAGYRNINVSKNSNNGPNFIVRIGQPGKTAVQKATYSHEQAIANSKQNIKLLIDLANEKHGKPDLIVFPETSYPYIVFNKDFPLVKEFGAKTIIGSNVYNNKNKEFYNSMLVAGLDENIEKFYGKSHLVPFGEYRPFGDIIPTPAQLTPGNGPEVITTNVNGNDFSFAPAICYEIIFSDSLINGSKKPQAIINITNDNWFGKTPGTYQHLDMVRRYAIESGLPIVRSNYSGISAFIDSDGFIKDSLPVGVTGVIDSKIGGHHMTIYRKIGRDGWMIIILMFSIICVKSISVFQKKD